ncbi:MAG: hypothetical protein R2682_01645 [Pyrinomonadaceae bacterium]
MLAVIGNHDGFTCPTCIKKEFPRVGIQVLDNTVVPIGTASSGRFRVIGLPDHMQLTYWKVFSDNAKRALAATEGQGPVIALEHSPDILEVITGDLLISKDLSLIPRGTRTADRCAFRSSGHRSSHRATGREASPA